MTSSQNVNKVPDVEALEEDEQQYGHGPLSKEEMQVSYPHRPINHSKTLPFHDLFLTLFNPLNDNKTKRTGPTIARAKQGPHGPSKLNPNEARKAIIERFFSRWRQDVGDDIYPALRLILPEKDRDRAMYGLKEKAIGKLLVKLMKIDKHSEDANNLLNWKLPGQSVASRMAGDFAGRCYEALSKRPMRTEVGDMRIAEVNELLDQLSAAQKEDHQLPIFEKFYDRMNADELMWLIRIILRQMKVGASEKTILNIWHPDGETLFNVSSSLRRVAWELRDHSIRLNVSTSNISLMNCFQPQLAQFQMNSFQKVVDNMRVTEDDPFFWIEEKLDGERMQLHMMKDKDIPGGMRFAFWSRKAKDYTYLYGNGFQDENSSLTRHIKGAFDPGVRNLILDGEMITWDMESDLAAPFGTLKTAALSEQRNPFQDTGMRPLFRVFDILYLNDTPLTQYVLRDRRKALEESIENINRRIEKHKFIEATTSMDIEPELRKVVENGLEGLVLKNPRSTYMLNERNNDWTKVKPEYMDEFGESLDCMIIGAYYGSGHRGGRLSSFLCGLRVGKNAIQMGANPMKFYSFFKVGGGFRAEDYQNIRHHTDGKWKDYDPKRPPSEYIELGGKDYNQYERPDVWIMPSDSVVVEVKAASVGGSDQFRTTFTLRFPRFKKLRMDMNWETALDEDEFSELRRHVEEEHREKEFKVDTRRKAVKKLKRDLVIAGNQQVEAPYSGPTTRIFEDLNFCILSEAKEQKKSKAELEQLVKAHGGKIFQNPAAKDDIIIIADKRVVKVASLMKTGKLNVVRPQWIFDTIAQTEIDVGQKNYLLPFEPEHMYFTTLENEEGIRNSVDSFGDSFARDLGYDEMKQRLDKMRLEASDRDESATSNFLDQLSRHGHDISNLKGWMFRGLHVYIDFEQPTDTSTVETDDVSSDLDLALAMNIINFAGGTVTADMEDESITHIVVHQGSTRLGALRKKISTRKRVPRISTVDWVNDSWKNGTLVDAERYAPIGK